VARFVWPSATCVARQTPRAIFNKIACGSLVLCLIWQGVTPPADTQTGWSYRSPRPHLGGRNHRALGRAICALLYLVFKEPRLRQFSIELFGIPPPTCVSRRPRSRLNSRSRFRLRFGGALQGNLSSLRRFPGPVNPFSVSTKTFSSTTHRHQTSSIRGVPSLGKAEVAR
jgi:hypothetical protein